MIEAVATLWAPVFLGVVMLVILSVMLWRSLKVKHYLLDRLAAFPPPPPRPVPTKTDLENAQAMQEWKKQWEAFNAKYPL